MDVNPHFLALLTYHATDDGGITIPALSGCRPSLKFPFDNDVFTSILRFVDTDLAFPGDVINTEITLLNTKHFKGKLYEGLDFDFFEGQNCIGQGIIKRILNPELS